MTKQEATELVQTIFNAGVGQPIKITDAINRLEKEELSDFHAVENLLATSFDSARGRLETLVYGKVFTEVEEARLLMIAQQIRRETSHLIPSYRAEHEGIILSKIANKLHSLRYNNDKS